MNTPVDEFETVKQLLASAAAYAESASRQADRNTTAIAELRETQDRNAEAIAELRETQDRNAEAIAELKDAQKKTEESLERLSQRLDAFVFESQRLHTEHAQRINRLDAMIDRYDGVLAYLMRKDHPEME